MGYQLEDLYSTRHAALIEALKLSGYSAGDDWKKTLANAKAIAVADGFDVSRYPACQSLRSIVSDAKKKSVGAAATVTAAAGGSVPAGGGSAPDALTRRIAALDTLRHLWLLKKSGSHKLWVLSLPMAYGDWPDRDLAGRSFDEISRRLDDKDSRFKTEDRKHLSEATQEGLKWIQKAMIVAAAPDEARHRALLKRWFADDGTTDAQLKAAAKTLNDGLKKMAATIKSTFLLMTDMPKDRGSADSARTNAFVFKDEAVDVIYVEGAFFGVNDTWKGLHNWTRIVVHELTHRDAKTADHRYRHNPAGLKPVAGTNFDHAKAIANADSWAIFCMDCGGVLTEEDYKKVKVA